MINYDTKEIVIKLNNFAYNAGIIGLLRVLSNAELIDVSDLEGTEIRLPFSALDNFDKYYIDTMIDTYSEFFPFNDLIRAYGSLKFNDDISAKIKILDILKDMKGKSVLSVYSQMIDVPFGISDSEIVKERKNSAEKAISNLASQMKECYKLPDDEKNHILEELYELYKPLIEKVIIHKRDIFMKLFAFRIINSFWGNCSFLYHTNYDKPIQSCYNEDFILPAQKLVSQQPKKEACTCLECGNIIGTKSDSFNLAWVKGLGIDSKRKTSPFWNFNPDDFICPICALIYTCIPLGFTTIKTGGSFMHLFINNSLNIRDMLRINTTIRENYQNNTNQDDKVTFRDIFSIYIDTLNEYEQPHHVMGMQIIKNFKDKFLIKEINKTHLDIITNNKVHLKRIAGNRISDGAGGYVYLYEEIIRKILNNESLTNLINQVIIQFIKNKIQNPYYLWDIISIQYYIHNIQKGGFDLNNSINSKQEMENKIWSMRYLGRRIRDSVSPFELNNKLKSYLYRLTSAVRANDSISFCTEITKMHMQCGVLIPANTVSMITDKNSFQDMAQAYIFGIMGDNKKEEK